MGGCTNKNTVIDGSIIKIGLVGDAACGKSSILHRFAENRFNLEYFHNTKNFTVVKSYIVNDLKDPVTIQVWEIQNKQLVEIDIAVIVADCRMSISGLQDYYWKWFLYCKDAGWEKVSIVLSKSDLSSNIKEDYIQVIRQNLALDPNQLLLKTSALKNEGIDTLFKSIISQFYATIKIRII